MLTDADIIRCAELMIQRYGTDAASRAAARAIELLASNEPAAGETWLRVKAAIEQLRARKPVPAEKVQ